MNRVALIILEENMPGMSGTELIKWTQKFLSEKKIQPEDYPKFAFRAQDFWTLSSEKIRKFFIYGVKREDILENFFDPKNL